MRTTTPATAARAARPATAARRGHRAEICAASSAAHSPRFQASTNPAARPKRLRLRIARIPRNPNSATSIISNGRPPARHVSPAVTMPRMAVPTPTTNEPLAGMPSHAVRPCSEPSRYARSHTTQLATATPLTAAKSRTSRDAFRRTTATRPPSATRPIGASCPSSIIRGEVPWPGKLSTDARIKTIARPKPPRPTSARPA